MTTLVEGKRSFFLGCQAELIENGRDMAASWASKHVVHNPAHAWVIGRYVEADRANSNRQLFSLEGLQLGQPTITHAPMNLNHQARRVMGAYVATELLYPTQTANAPATKTCPACGEMFDASLYPAGACPHCGVGDQPAMAAAAELNPYIEALGVVWKHYFRDEFALVESAHAEGKLYFSMECVSDKIECAGEGGCGGSYDYAGVQSPTYCEHINQHTCDRYLVNPHFLAGAILIPPVQPGWNQAKVHSLVAKHADLADRIYEGVKEDLSHLDASEWEAVMGELLVMACR